MNLNVLSNINKELSCYKKNKPKLLAVTKYSDFKEINLAIENWVSIIWENRLESANKKFPNIKYDVEKHFIWVVQTKKLRKIINLFDVIESISSIKQLIKVNNIWEELNKKIKIFLQFNISWEIQKSWFTEDNILDIIDISHNLNNVSILWIMWMWSNSSLKINRKEFKKAKKIFDILKSKISSIKELSIWMSNDYKIALEEWSTLVRIGSLIFK